MAEALYVLYETGNWYEDSENLHDSLVNDQLLESFPGEFEYFSTGWDESVQEDSFFGRDDPEKMREYANSWNARLSQTLRLAEEAVRKDMEEKKYDDFVSYIADNRDGPPAYAFREAMDESTGSFRYGHNYLAHTEYSGWTTVLSDRDIKDINAHPENYAVVLCLYH